MLWRIRRESLREDFEGVVVDSTEIEVVVLDGVVVDRAEIEVVVLTGERNS